MGSNPLTVLRVCGATSVEIPPRRILMSAGNDGRLQRDEHWLRQRIVTPESNSVFQLQRPLRFSIRYKRTGWESCLTWYGNLARVRAPIVVKDLLKVNQVATLFLLCPRSMAAFHLDLHPHLRCRRNTPAYAHASDSAHCEETKAILALRWCPGLVIVPL